MSKSFLKDPIRLHCPCADSPADAPPPTEEDELSTTEDSPDRVSDPTLPRAKYSLHPLGYLYFCQECQAIRCPRCVQEEIVSAFCPMCLFEVPLTSIKADGNRCVRNCFQCPICFSGLNVFPNEETQGAPYTLNCTYCQWSSSEIGVEFEKATGISGIPVIKVWGLRTGQLSKLVAPYSEAQTEFEALRDHYANLFDAGRPSEDAMATFSSRYSALLAGKGSFKSRQSTRSLYSRMRPPSRDTDDKPLEYEQVKPLEDERALISQLESLTHLEDTTTMRQRAKQPSKPRWEKDLWPISMQLRAKRSKRCRACRHILVKPENKPTSTRFRIKMLALNYIPTMQFRQHVPNPELSPSSLVAKPPAHILTPGTTHSFILTITNPLYDPIQLTLSTPAKAPGAYPHATTILRPEFTVGANADIWNDDEEIISSTDKEKRKSKFGIYEAKRNTVSIFMEVVPAIMESTSSEDSGDRSAAEKTEIPVEIPIFVKMIYQTEDVEKDDTLSLVNQVLEEDKGKGKTAKEIGYWVVVRVGSVVI